jgi:hypothetical protein
MFVKVYTGHEISRTLNVPEIMTGKIKLVRLSVLRTDRLYPPRTFFWYSFLLEVESNPGPQYGWKANPAVILTAVSISFS